MAASTNPLVWDFYRMIGSDTSAHLGGTVHYFNNEAQCIFLNNGLKTRLTEIENGQWVNSVYTEPSQWINEEPYTDLDLDHPMNGTLFLSVSDATGTVRLLRYQYAADLSDITANVTFVSQVDNPITQITGTLANIDNDWVYADA
jgi:hypothetical protein